MIGGKKIQKKPTKENPTKPQKKNNNVNTNKKNDELNTKKKYGIIVLDLDETLFHTKNSGTEIHYRPKLKNFLVYLNKYFYLVVYTAALKSYADKILEGIEIAEGISAKNLFALLLYRNSVTNEGKDLRVVFKKLIKKKEDKKINIPDNFIFKGNKGELNFDNIILIDNLTENFLDTQFFNGIPIKDFYQNDDDNSLVMLKNFFKNYLKLKQKNKSMNLRNYLYKNLYKLNSILKIQYNKC